MAHYAIQYFNKATALRRELSFLPCAVQLAPADAPTVRQTVRLENVACSRSGLREQREVSVHLPQSVIQQALTLSAVLSGRLKRSSVISAASWAPTRARQSTGFSRHSRVSSTVLAIRRKRQRGIADC